MMRCKSAISGMAALFLAGGLTAVAAADTVVMHARPGRLDPLYEQAKWVVIAQCQERKEELGQVVGGVFRVLDTLKGESIPERIECSDAFVMLQVVQDDAPVLLFIKDIKDRTIEPVMGSRGALRLVGADENAAEAVRTYIGIQAQEDAARKNAALRSFVFEQLNGSPDDSYIAVECAERVLEKVTQAVPWDLNRQEKQDLVKQIAERGSYRTNIPLCLSLDALDDPAVVDACMQTMEKAHYLPGDTRLWPAIRKRQELQDRILQAAIHESDKQNIIGLWNQLQCLPAEKLIPISQTIWRSNRASRDTLHMFMSQPVYPQSIRDALAALEQETTEVENPPEVQPPTLGPPPEAGPEKDVPASESEPRGGRPVYLVYVLLAAAILAGGILLLRRRR
jgi:hypothetical protein